MCLRINCCTTTRTSRQGVNTEAMVFLTLPRLRSMRLSNYLTLIHTVSITLIADCLSKAVSKPPTFPSHQYTPSSLHLLNTQMYPRSLHPLPVNPSSHCDLSSVSIIHFLFKILLVLIPPSSSALLHIKHLLVCLSWLSLNSVTLSLKTNA